MAPSIFNSALAADTSGIDGSSLDELALSTKQPPSARTAKKTPLAPQSTNTRISRFALGATPLLRSSPAKSVYLETDGQPGTSPWRIKVTVQAEQHEDEMKSETPSRRATSRTKVTTVPLKDPDEPSPVKRGPGRPRRSDASPSAVKKRKGTPLRRRSKRLSGDVENLVSLSTEQPTPKRGRGRPRKIVPQVQPELVQSSDEEDVQEISTPKRNRPVRQSEESESSPSPFKPSYEENDINEPRLESSPEHSTRSIPPRRITDMLQPLQSSPPAHLNQRLPNNSKSTPNKIASASSIQSQPLTASLPPLPQFDFTTLTPLHKKHTIAPMEPPPQKHIRARPTPRLQSKGIVPAGWSTAIHSPLPSEVAPAKMTTPRQSQRTQNPSPRRPMFQSPDRRQETEESDEEVWRNMITYRPDDASTQGEEAPGEETPGTDSDDSEYGEVPDLTGRAIGENTLMQSEDFSMVSLDSLESVRGVHSSFLEGSQADAGHRSMYELQDVEQVSHHTLQQQPTSVKRPSRLNQAWLPGSSPKEAHLSPNVSVQRGRHSSRPLPSPFPPKLPSKKLHSSPATISHPEQSIQNRARLAPDEIESSPIEPAPTSSFLAASSQRRSASISLTKEVPERLVEDFPAAESIPSHRHLDQSSSKHSARLPTPSSIDKEQQSVERSPSRTQNSKSRHHIRLSSPPAINVSPAKSDGAGSLQTQTPPSTYKGSSPMIEHGTGAPNGVARSPAALHLASSPPNQTMYADDLEETRQADRAQEALGEEYRLLKEGTAEIAEVRARLTPQSARWHDVITIESDKSEDSEENEEDTDIWQDEASRDTDVAESSYLARPQHAEPDVKRKLFSKAIERSDSPRRTKVRRTEKPFRASDDDEPPVQNVHHSIEEEYGRQKKNADDISALFRNVTGHARDGTESEGSDDSGMFMQRNLPTVFPEIKGRRKVGRRPSSSIDRHSLEVSPKPARGSHLSRQAAQGDNSTSVIQAGSFVSVASDVRQLRNDMEFAQKEASSAQQSRKQSILKSAHSTHTRTQTVLANLGSVNTTVEEEEEVEQDKYDRSSLLALHPGPPTKDLFRDNLFDEISKVESQRRDKRQTRAPLAKINEATQQPKPSVNAQPPKTTEKGKMARRENKSELVVAAPPPNILTKVWSSLPSLSIWTRTTDDTGPPRPNHPLLLDLPLLPRAHPFTKTHYQVMDKLYTRYKKSPASFSTSHPTNAGLMTPSLFKYIDITFTNWGYEETLNSSLIILVSLYTRLLVLKDIPEFERIEGQSIIMGDPGNRWIEANQDKIERGQEVPLRNFMLLRRLFTIVGGEKLRRDERRGVPIDKTENLKFKFKGQPEWREAGA